MDDVARRVNLANLTLSERSQSHSPWALSRVLGTEDGGAGEGGEVGREGRREGANGAELQFGEMRKLQRQMVRTLHNIGTCFMP